MTKEQHRAQRAQWRAERRCIQCGAPVEFLSTTCAAHAEANRRMHNPEAGRDTKRSGGEREKVPLAEGEEGAGPERSAMSKSDLIKKLQPVGVFPTSEGLVVSLGDLRDDPVRILIPWHKITDALCDRMAQIEERERFEFQRIRKKCRSNTSVATSKTKERQR
jgi:hypothetical protein